MPKYLTHRFAISGLMLCAIGLAIVGIVIWQNALAYEGGAFVNRDSITDNHQNQPILQVEVDQKLMMVDTKEPEEVNAAVVDFSRPIEPSNPPKEVTLPARETSMRLQIPSLGLDAAVEKIGLTPEGALDVPKKQMNTGWYEHGPQPGQLGNAVLAGHVDWYNGASAVFKNLHKLTVGEKILAKNDQGEVFNFIVREVRTYGADEIATEVFIANDSKPHLNLITCSGKWNHQVGGYSHRLVVFADLEN